MLRFLGVTLVFVAACAIASADPQREYMDNVLRQAGTYLAELGLEPARASAPHNLNSGSLQVEISNVVINGLGALTTKKCKLEKPKLECDVSLKSLNAIAYGRATDGSGSPHDIAVQLPIKEGELEIEVNSATRLVKVKFDDKLKLDKIRFNPAVSSNSKAVDAISKQLEEKLAGSVSDFITNEYFNIVKNAAMHAARHVALPTS